MDFEFIKDSALRKKIEDSVEYIFALYEEAKRGDKNELFKTETFRVIILYTVSIIEAVLLYIYHQRESRMVKEEHKEIQTLENQYKNTHVEGRVVVSVVKKSEKKDIEIRFQEIVKFLQNEKVLRSETADRMLEINDTRNTFHLRKERMSPCTVGEVEGALELLLYVLGNAPKSIKK